MKQRGEKNAVEYWRRETWNVRNLLRTVYPFIDNPRAKKMIKTYLDFHEIDLLLSGEAVVLENEKPIEA